MSTTFAHQLLEVLESRLDDHETGGRIGGDVTGTWPNLTVTLRMSYEHAKQLTAVFAPYRFGYSGSASSGFGDWRFTGPIILDHEPVPYLDHVEAAIEVRVPLLEAAVMAAYLDRTDISHEDFLRFLDVPAPAEQSHSEEHSNTGVGIVT